MIRPSRFRGQWPPTGPGGPLHPTPRNCVEIATWPFQIPLGALIPERVQNFLPTCKNSGSTHITDGCYRLQPVEWNIGESVGALAAYCLAQGETPKAVHETPRMELFSRVD
ncbi:FAD-dependent oxidoreductase [Pseudoroseicyclus sp. H15]